MEDGCTREVDAIRDSVRDPSECSESAPPTINRSLRFIKLSYFTRCVVASQSC